MCIVLTVSVSVWREFLWGAIAGGFGEGMMHPIDTVKTRLQSQAILSQTQVCFSFYTYASYYQSMLHVLIIY